MQADTVADRIGKFILERFPLARKRGISNQAQLLSGGIIDSLGVLEVVDFVEREFEITVTDDELLPDHFQSISHIAALVQSKSSGARVR